MVVNPVQLNRGIFQMVLNLVQLYIEHKVVSFSNLLVRCLSYKNIQDGVYRFCQKGLTMARIWQKPPSLSPMSGEALSQYFFVVTQASVHTLVEA
jgi:hypothetical protein